MRSVPLAALAILLLGAAPAAAKTENCKNTYGGDFIRAHDVKCQNARAVVRAWATGFKADGNPNRQARGFNCTGTNDPFEGLIIKCTRPAGKRITFYANVP